MNQGEIDAAARESIGRWLERFADFGPQERALALATLAAVAEDMAAREVMKLLPFAHLVSDKT